jgi:predicted amidohydrolase
VVISIFAAIIINNPQPITKMKDLRITTVQADLVWENKIENLLKFDELLRGIKRGGTDVIVLPEMFTTGFSMKPAEFAETMQDATIFWLKKKAWELDVAITGSFICAENGHFYNRLVWMQPDGKASVYDKRHRFTLAKENEFYTEGAEKLIVEWRGWRICPLICYDLRFPVWARNTKNKDSVDYDILMYVANWPIARSHHWRILTEARAVENQSFVVAVNRVGTDANGYEHRGDTSVVDYAGDILLRRSFTEGVDTTVLSKAKLENYRKKFGFLADQDVFEIIV